MTTREGGWRIGKTNITAAQFEELAQRRGWWHKYITQRRGPDYFIQLALSGRWKFQ